MTGEAARQAFLDWLARERRAADLTVETYGGCLAGFLGFLTNHLGAEPDLDQLRTLRLADLRAWLAHAANQGASNATRAKHLSAVRSFFRFLARRHGVDNPALKLITAPRAKKPLPRALAPEQARAVTDDIAEMADTAALQARDTALFTLLYGCGLRIAEALALDVRDAPLRCCVWSARGLRSASCRCCRRCAMRSPAGCVCTRIASPPARCFSARAASGSIRRWRKKCCATSDACTACPS